VGIFEPATASAEGLILARRRLVHNLAERRGIRSRAVLDAMARVPREQFVLPEQRPHAYADCALPIDHDQTISQPYIVALMTELAELEPGMRVLEIGTGCGYQTAVLAATGAEVFSVEIIEALAACARARLRDLAVPAHLFVGDGHAGLPAHAPYDAIVVTAAPARLPRALIDQLAVGGRLVVPIGEEHGDQELVVVRRLPGGGETIDQVAAVRFVPMTGVERSASAPARPFGKL
jgi:protein-L-isoaspartate(D-aspartate) O-methyltransferase